MTVALSILFAALVGGVVFMLLDGWQRKPAEPAAVAATPPREPRAPIWTPEPEPEAWQRPAREAETQPGPAWEPPSPRRESPPLWTPPPRPSGRWDDDDRHRDEDDDNRPPGLWSGWANR
jgi:hypothetical protein